MGFSIIALIDESSNCEGESKLGYGGTVIWATMLVYLLVGLYLVCENHFVPSLQILGNKLGLSEDAQGATIMAAGSSSPEFFTALIGVLFYSSENPGPGTIVGSAVFNVCVIVGCCALFAPRALPLDKFPLYRDSISYLVSSTFLCLSYEVITPGQVDIWESFLMMAMYFSYVFLVCKEGLLRRCVERVLCCCYYDVRGYGFRQVSAEDEDGDHEHDMKPGGDSIESDPDAIEMGTLQTRPRRESTASQCSEVAVTTPAESMQRERELEGTTETEKTREDDVCNDDLKTLNSDGTELNEPFNLSVQDDDPRGHEAKRRTGRSERKLSALGLRSSWLRSIVSCFFKYSKLPMELMFKFTIPNPEYFISYRYCFVFTFVLSVVWLAIFSFLIVDLAEKLGNCIGISEDLLGLSVLAIGSSLPDCISSVLIAMELKGDMAVSNALGSNVFDILFCLGTTFFIQSCMNGGGSIKVESGTGFSSLIVLLFVLQAIFNGLLYLSNHMLKSWHGYTLLAVYIIFVVWFIVDYEVVVPNQEGST
mmetsp:Transcript_16721/g.23394  ORF Transcript_16721/g.23394 Transcript_16721/m.23394 type:complete len:536 (+) Transcript_16721:192-1799(+)|eukprot:CAMPEP_0184486918 /NCGR_PEP_ID=MMETSP0113_2-20130426/8790_1 /TAXON_ID=91329 /ORGANISM="Norrisiella sphaerica, Strain BC52" /LENGTH=535 /DNA_ID=CAMNT_0026868997 /DNA_START=195 /DNA_END=1802 /DNA_ORIENTATION=+